MNLTDRLALRMAQMVEVMDKPGLNRKAVVWKSNVSEAKALLGLYEEDPATVEPLTTAYIAIGVRKALEHRQKTGQDIDIDSFDGELGLVGHIISYAQMLESKLLKIEPAGVFDYEVSEPFGETMAHLLMDGVAAYPEEIADNLIAQMQGEQP